MKDWLSNFLATTSVVEARWSVLRLGAGANFTARQKLCVYVVVDGAVQFHVKNRPVTTLTKGDCMVAFATRHKIMETSSRIGSVVSVPESRQPLSWHQLGDGRTKAIVAQGRIEVDPALSQYILEIVPAIFAVRSPTGRMPSWLNIFESTADLDRTLTHEGAAAFGTKFAELCLTQAIRDYLAANPSSLQPTKKVLTYSKIAEAVRLMNANPSHPWSVVSLAARIGMSRSIFAERFLEHIGSAPIHYLKQARMTISAQILASSNASIGDVARRVGYSSEISFNRTFKSFYGVTPANFRNLQRHRSARHDQMWPLAHPAFVFLNDG